MKIIDRMKALIAFVFLANLTSAAFSQSKENNPPNVIIILADDMGYGDLSCYGHPTIVTPHLDKMAADGMKFTQFYVAANVCTPSRAGLLTGRLPVRSGMAGSDSSGNVLYPFSTGGLPQYEVTIAEALKTKGYRTEIIGKWHLGHLPEFLPMKQGFDSFFGIPYSNDMFGPAYRNAPPLPFYKDGKVIEENPDQSLFTQRYTAEAIRFIKANKNNPFFLYYANNYPHTPLHASKDFKGRSKRGLYGDVVEELDWSVGQILSLLQELKLDRKTLVLFLSDNGPWLKQKEDGGSAGPLFEGKGSAYEGGMRVPAIAWWPGTIKPRQVSTSIVTTLDIFPTVLKLAKVPLPDDRVLDGKDFYPVLLDAKGEVNDEVYYYTRDKLYAIRKGPWKVHFITRPSYTKEPPVVHEPPLLFNIEVDPSEKYEVGEAHPEVIEEFKNLYKKQQASLSPVPSYLDGGYKRK